MRATERTRDKNILNSDTKSKASLQRVKFNDLRSHHSLQFVDQLVQKVDNTTGMPDNLKAGVENLSGIDMSDVKVHYNSSRPAQFQALAYAQGNQIHLGPGQEKHLPHEAWHVVQQKQGRVKPTRQLKGQTNVNDDSALEKEADDYGKILSRTDFSQTSQLKSTRSHFATSNQVLQPVWVEGLPYRSGPHAFTQSVALRNVSSDDLVDILCNSWVMQGQHVDRSQAIAFAREIATSTKRWTSQKVVQAFQEFSGAQTGRLQPSHHQANQSLTPLTDRLQEEFARIDARSRQRETYTDESTTYAPGGFTTTVRVDSRPGELHREIITNHPSGVSTVTHVHQVSNASGTTTTRRTVTSGPGEDVVPVYRPSTDTTRGSSFLTGDGGDSHGEPPVIPHHLPVRPRQVPIPNPGFQRVNPRFLPTPPGGVHGDGVVYTDESSWLDVGANVFYAGGPEAPVQTVYTLPDSLNRQRSGHLPDRGSNMGGAIDAANITGDVFALGQQVRDFAQDPRPHRAGRAGMTVASGVNNVASLTGHSMAAATGPAVAFGYCVRAGWQTGVNAVKLSRLNDLKEQGFRAEYAAILKYAIEKRRRKLIRSIVAIGASGAMGASLVAGPAGIPLLIIGAAGGALLAGWMLLSNLSKRLGDGRRDRAATARQLEAGCARRDREAILILEALGLEARASADQIAEKLRSTP